MQAEVQGWIWEGEREGGLIWLGGEREVNISMGLSNNACIGK